MAKALRVAIDVGNQSHQVAVGNPDGELIDEFRIDHRAEGLAQFFARIERHGVTDIRGDGVEPKIPRVCGVHFTIR